MNYTQLVDEFADIKHQLKPLEERLDILKKEAAATCEKSLVGTHHKLSVTYYPQSETIDYKSLIADLQIEVPDKYRKPKAAYTACTLRTI